LFFSPGSQGEFVPAAGARMRLYRSSLMARKTSEFQTGNGGFRRRLSAELCHYTYSLLPPGDYDCRVVIRNLETGQTAVARDRTSIAAASDAPLTLLPAAPSPAGSRDILFRRPEKEERVRRGHTLPDGVYPFDPKQYSPWTSELPARFVEVYALVVCSLGISPNRIWNFRSL